MNIAERDRERIETALDRLWEVARQQASRLELIDLTPLYMQAIAIVREKPAGVRRLRSDFDQKKASRTGELKL